MKMKESELQTACVKWFRLQYKEYQNLLFAVPNGGSRNILEASNLKKQGVLAGVSDLILLKANKEFSSLCIELKVGKNRQSKAQKEFQTAVEKNSSKYIICRTIQDFINEIQKYLNQNDF